eukprot:366183-Chlamydomonas_euryale.AAC.3
MGLESDWRNGGMRGRDGCPGHGSCRQRSQGRSAGQGRANRSCEGPTLLFPFPLCEAGLTRRPGDVVVKGHGRGRAAEGKQGRETGRGGEGNEGEGRERNSGSVNRVTSSGRGVLPCPEACANRRLSTPARPVLRPGTGRSSLPAETACPPLLRHST